MPLKGSGVGNKHSRTVGRSDIGKRGKKGSIGKAFSWLATGSATLLTHVQPCVIALLTVKAAGEAPGVYLQAEGEPVCTLRKLVAVTHGRFSPTDQ